MRLFSPSCVLCDADAKMGVSLCASCMHDLPRIDHSCPRCGLPAALGSADTQCGQCQQDLPPIDYMISSLAYDYPVGHLVAQLKFQRNLVYANIFSHLLLEKLCTTLTDSQQPELIIPIPLHKKRLRERGFNQALEIARPIAKQLSIPLEKRAIIRPKYTQAQSLLDAESRHENLKSSFEIVKPVTAEHVVIVDDVVTTGATVYELAGLLKRSGVKTVGVWAVARA